LGQESQSIYILSTYYLPPKRGLICLYALQQGIKAITASLLLSFGHTNWVLVEGYWYTDHLFSGKQHFFSPLPLAPGFGSFTEKPVSYLIGVHLHSLAHSAIPQVKGKSGYWKKDCITQCAELLILNKT